MGRGTIGLPEMERANNPVNNGLTARIELPANGAPGVAEDLRTVIRTVWNALAIPNVTWQSVEGNLTGMLFSNHSVVNFFIRGAFVGLADVGKGTLVAPGAPPHYEPHHSWSAIDALAYECAAITTVALYFDIGNVGTTP